MIIRVSDIEDEGVQIDDPSALGHPYSESSWHLDAISLHVAREEAEVMVTGEIRATVPQTCGRCLETLPVSVRTQVDLRVLPRPAASAEGIELGPDDLDTDFYENDELNVNALVENETTLALPMKPLCREDCRGLCPQCGVNRNVTRCDCPERPPDPRLVGLKDLADRLRKP